ncbi:3-hexulose-6-phosphate isomerase [Bhargavaea cecembensis DSE10]|uniref:3-hexulose-6-phosphate isomerase n=1 Tax=Bhargavaea cecembensis DSE10 TaxID=1235279 RepID=M7NHG9_9BACL|nr:6-phospho-3-hexuloisomerase [Bhargavaea cecembensis]EMR06631.1 3-hexulose-6-phosphate isomerase [Bhargavaea cecembensis DSE10]
MVTPSVILQEVSQVIGKVDPRQYRQLKEMLNEPGRLFIFGEGRSGLLGRMIAMRLMHCGCKVFVVDETITPSLAKEDRLLVISGSGNSARIRDMAKKSEGAGYRIWLVTANGEALGETWCEGGLLIPAATRSRKSGEPGTIQPLGNQFDQSAHLLLDALVIDGPASGLDHQSLKDRHSNL